MPLVRGCNFPDHLLYDVEHHVWYAVGDDGLLRAGITVIGVALAREVLVFTPKRPGTEFEKDRALAIVESAKWTGSVRSAFDGTVVAVNESLKARPHIVNNDCYGKGWMVQLRPSAGNWREKLIAGTDVASAYEAWMEDTAFAGCGS
ncbi:MAG: glycine cleavage system protein H [Xanthobacteraceae bacterium]|nr:glycine cleavage system protein H [Xanthobacteraceae bacterium]QYK46239.1 MAG: glycine cleavage system protein H [Xanthobacteraceae bacterium]HMN52264.1 glycine cleavage system protein H [Xanthobacteraceae bacterium]